VIRALLPLAVLVLAGAAPAPTPVAERVVTVAALDKDSSEVREFKIKPGETVRFGKIRITARTCEKQPPWEEQLTGAFLQIDSLEGERPQRVFSGWLFVESPSLNSFDNPRYDVWVRSCAMSFPESEPSPKSRDSKSSAEKSASSASADDSHSR
jgi:hypothetical protein